jgi:plastocyanin
MRTKKFLWVGIGTVLVFTLIIILGYEKKSNAAEKCTIVSIRSPAGVEPEVLKITKGDCVVWINWTRGEDVKVIFREGKKCAEATKAPVGFKKDFSGCYVTDFLAFGQTSSLMFPVEGSFDYEVEFQRKIGKTVKGSIQVK